MEGRTPNASPVKRVTTGRGGGSSGWLDYWRVEEESSGGDGMDGGTGNTHYWQPSRAFERASLRASLRASSGIQGAGAWTTAWNRPEGGDLRRKIVRTRQAALLAFAPAPPQQQQCSMYSYMHATPRYVYAAIRSLSRKHETRFPGDQEEPVDGLAGRQQAIMISFSFFFFFRPAQG